MKIDQPGAKATALLVGGALDHYGQLPDRAVEQWRSIEKHKADLWNAGDKRRSIAIGGCLEKLSATLRQVARLHTFYNTLLEQAQDNLRVPGSFALRGAEACGDFEALLLQGRSALDRLTWFIAAEFGQKCQSFRQLKKIASNSGRKDLAYLLVGILDQATPWTVGFLASADTEQSFRDFVAHRGSSIEEMTCCFAVTRLGDGRFLVVDCELGGFPVFTRSSEAVQYLSFVVLNSLAVAAKLPLHGLDAYEALWRPQAAAISKYLLHEPTNTALGPNAFSYVRCMIPDGMTMAFVNVRPELFALALKLDPKVL